MTLVYLLSQANFWPNYYTMIYQWEIIQYLYCIFVFNRNLPKRKYTVLYCIIGALAMFGYGFLLGFLRTYWPDSSGFKVLATLSLYSCSLLMTIFCYNEKHWSNILMAWVTALCAREVIDASYTLIAMIAGFNPRIGIISLGGDPVFDMMLFDAMHLVLLLALVFAFRKRIQLAQEKSIAIRIIAISLSMLFGLVVIKTIAIIYSEMALNLFACCEALILLVSVLLLFIRSDLLRESSYKIDQQIMHQVIASNQKQYESLKTNIDVINMKAHDLRHQLEKYQDRLTKEEVDSFRQSVDVYDKNINTGSPVLDTVLYSEHLICDQNNIHFTYLCDGRNLNRFPSSQLYYLFSNIIDNAIEACMEVEEKNRVISFNIKEKDNQIVIDSCNYFKGERDIHDGVISTTKKDARLHGYGLKSIGMIVAENKGSMNIHTENNMFFMVINLPFPDKEEKRTKGL